MLYIQYIFCLIGHYKNPAWPEQVNTGWAGKPFVQLESYFPAPLLPEQIDERYKLIKKNVWDFLFALTACDVALKLLLIYQLLLTGKNVFQERPAGCWI